MENMPVINLVAITVPPWEDERYNKWVEGAYYQVSMQSPWFTGSDRYSMVSGSPDYPRRISIHYHTDIRGWESHQKTEVMSAVVKDLGNWHRQIIWYGTYEMLKSFRINTTPGEGKHTSFVDDAPILHLTAFDLNAQDGDKYKAWFNEMGQKVYIPILMKLPGLKAIDCYEWTGKFDAKAGNPARQGNATYPLHASFAYFESLKAFDNYTESPELVAFHESLKTAFPRGLNYKWYVTYQLTRSWRK